MPFASLLFNCGKSVYLDAQAGTDADARALLRAEIADIIEGFGP
jgi:hypothetical protein